MASMVRSESIAEPSSTPTLSSKTLPAVNGASSAAAAPGASGTPLKPATTNSTKSSAPRIDIEPLYTALKAHIGDHWAAYKEAISLFVLGESWAIGAEERASPAAALALTSLSHDFVCALQPAPAHNPCMLYVSAELTCCPPTTGRLNQQELSRRIDWFIAADSAREHLHNQLVAAIYANTTRDPPEPGVASWVSANDKPSATSKPSSGDAAELRLKTEVKELQGRERKRLKAIPDDPTDYFTREMQEYHAAKQISLPDPGASSAAGFSKTSADWDLEIRKRYAQPLCTETFEFPDTAAIEARMTPICYEEGIASGASPDAAGFMNIATETFIKEILSNILGRVRSNGDDYIKTAAYKRQLQREEEMWLQGEVQRSPAGLLPVEIDESKNRKPLNMGDLRIALELGDSYLGQVPLITAGILNARYYDGESYEAEKMDFEEYNASTHNTAVARLTNGPVINGVNGTNGTHHDPDEMMIDDDWGWQGVTTKDREAINSVLDDILTIGQ
ncbi:transcriptional regulator of RNA polII, SAGA, subunit-domain-containing protein [Macrophomina phaseolina]|uniref:Transcriptional regulator of RNA polII, SAGA, subunit-domain-containing protein n=1 Tax=Macrophomina phaseolina TaxID=35725 RepID=A0ABQ8GU19_9PEZI|nr:transcriptional regulator of RNA polII, SAGA, subunit-domain-containing protein [Macrophomina phaseolina]